MTTVSAGTAAARHPLAVGHIIGASVALSALLAALSPLYGYHRDELYFRMLPPAWGYTDQPPLLPLVVRAAIGLFGDTVVGIRIVALVLAVASLLILALITRELGGDRRAQAYTAWGMAGATMTLLFGHVLLTASLDLVVWPATLLFAIRAVMRDDGRWWLAAGAVIGASSYNKLLGAVLIVAIALGLAALGPRRWFSSGWLWAGAGLAALLAVPNAIYQATHGWPQLAMGAALAENNADEVRTMMWLFLVLLPGPVLAVFWAVGLVGLFRRRHWRPVQWFAVVFAVTVCFVFVAATQFYYTAGVLAVGVAIGAVLVSQWAATRARRVVIVVALLLNAAGCAITSVPLLPVEAFGASGLGSVNSAAADQVGWERYAQQVTDAATAADADVVIASNYGEAGALDRYGSGGIPVVSGHNALWDLGGPDESATTAVIVGGQAFAAREAFSSCTIVDRLDNGVGVDNEEEGLPIMVCEGPSAPWADLWPRFRHLD